MYLQFKSGNPLLSSTLMVIGKGRKAVDQIALLVATEALQIRLRNKSKLIVSSKPINLQRKNGRRKKRMI
jgi:hypothetical protein